MGCGTCQLLSANKWKQHWHSVGSIVVLQQFINTHTHTHSYASGTGVLEEGGRFPDEGSRDGD